jgi:hypothetical protein
MTEPSGQDSLLGLAEEAALWPPGMIPDPAIMTQYVTGVHQGLWHAINRAALEYAMGAVPRMAAVAACGALVRVTKHGVYDRAEPPVSLSPCPACAWHVAIATGSARRELQLLAPGPREAAALARRGVTPLIAVAVCRAILAAAEDPAHPAVVRQLAAAVAHRPDLAIGADCAGGECDHGPEDPGEDGQPQCDYPDARAVCWACSLRTGSRDGEGGGSLMDGGAVRAPCGVLLALAAHHGLTRG